jgi:hypothetical protein
MSALTTHNPLTAAVLVDRARQALDGAESAAEVIDARLMATAAYDAAKAAARFSKMKQASDEMIGRAHRLQADAAEIEFLCKRRLADEYDAAQERGEASTGRPKSIPDGKTFTATEIGLTSKDIHEARQIRDAEKAEPGIVRRTLDSMIERGEEPTKAAVKREIMQRPAPRQPVVRDDALWLWGRLIDMERDGYFDKDPSALFAGMTEQMRADVRRLAPAAAEFFLQIGDARVAA